MYSPPLPLHNASRVVLGTQSPVLAHPQAPISADPRQGTLLTQPMLLQGNPSTNEVGRRCMFKSSF